MQFSISSREMLGLILILRFGKGRLRIRVIVLRNTETLRFMNSLKYDYPSLGAFFDIEFMRIQQVEDQCYHIHQKFSVSIFMRK